MENKDMVLEEMENKMEARNGLVKQYEGMNKGPQYQLSVILFCFMIRLKMIVIVILLVDISLVQ